MPYVVGIVLAGRCTVREARVGFNRDRAFYPTMLIVIASYYVLFAASAANDADSRLIRRSRKTLSRTCSGTDLSSPS